MRAGRRIVAVADEDKAGIITRCRRRNADIRGAAEIDVRIGAGHEEGDAVPDDGLGAGDGQFAILDDEQPVRQRAAPGRERGRAVAGQRDAAAIDAGGKRDIAGGRREIGEIAILRPVIEGGRRLGEAGERIGNLGAGIGIRRRREIGRSQFFQATADIDLRSAGRDDFDDGLALPLQGFGRMA